MTPLFESGLSALKSGHAEVALAQLAEVVRLKPSDHRARLMAARAMGEMGEPERAMLALHAAAEGMLRRDYLLSSILAIKLALRFNPAEKLLKKTLAEIHARARVVTLQQAEAPKPPPLPTAASKPPPLPTASATPPPLPASPVGPPPLPAAAPAAAAEPSSPATEPAPAPGAEAAAPAANPELSGLRGSELVERALEVLMGDDDGPPADVRKRPPLPLFVDLEPEAFVDLVERTSVREFVKGDPVVREGEPGASVFVIIAGTAKVVAEGPPPRDVATLRGGALFGELSILTGAPRSASIYATSDIELLEISRDDLDFVSKTHPSVPKVLAEFAQRRLAMNLLATAPLFTQLESGHRGPVLQRFRGRIIPAGERVIAEGEPSPGLFLILSGEFSVTKKDPAGEPLALKILGDGEVFGEISLLSGGPAGASVTAVRRSAAAFLPRDAYDELVQSYPQIEDFLMQLSQKRLSDNAAATQPMEVLDAEDLIEG